MNKFFNQEQLRIRWEWFSLEVLPSKVMIFGEADHFKPITNFNKKEPFFYGFRIRNPSPLDTPASI